MEVGIKHKLLHFLFRYGAIFVVIGVFVYFSLRLEHFLTASNIGDIMASISIVTFVALGVTFSLIVDGFDLSVGSTVSLTTVVTASMMVWYEMPMIVVIGVPLLIGALVGLLNALFIIKFRVPDLLATLAVMYIIAGIHKTYTKGYSINDHMLFPDGTKAPGVITTSFQTIGQGEFYIGSLSVPIPVLFMVLAIVAAHLLLRYTRFGRQMYMTGGNREAARLSGIRVNRIRTLAYVISGICAAIGGILFTSRVGTGEIDAGAPLLMEAVAAVFVGFSVFGAGKPNVFGTFIGALLIGVLVNGLTMMNLQYYTHDIIKGTVLVLALSITFYVVNRGRSSSS
nr:ABC transporter permease [Paenibacillus arenosi]